MAFGLVLTLIGIGTACFLIYNAAVFALPVACGFWIGFGTLHLGGGPLAGIVLGCIAGGIVFELGKTAFCRSHSTLLRYAVVLVFVVPAMWVGYSAVQQISELLSTSGISRHVLAVVGAVAVGSSAFARLTNVHSTDYQRAV